MLGGYNVFKISTGFGYPSICFPPILVFFFIKYIVISFKDIIKKNLMSDFSMTGYLSPLIFVK